MTAMKHGLLVVRLFYLIGLGLIPNGAGTMVYWFGV